MDASRALEFWVDGRSLSDSHAELVMGQILSGELSEALIGGLLIALRAKGPSVAELVGFAQCLRNLSITVDLNSDDLVDNCGTGGGPATWNLSTGAAIVASAAGAKVGKHGNRAVTSKCGSADVLESLGIRLVDSPAMATSHFQAIGIAFLFAPNFHPGLKVVGPIRRALGVRTVFNLLGPLVNPAGAKRQLIGIYDPTLLATLAEALGELGAESAWVVCAEDGLDEISPVHPTRVAAWQNGTIAEFTVTPADFGITTHVKLEPGTDVEANAQILSSSLSPAATELSEALIPNAAATLMLAGVVDSLPKAVAAARQAIASGAALEKLIAWQEVSRIELA